MLLDSWDKGVQSCEVLETGDELGQEKKAYW